MAQAVPTWPPCERFLLGLVDLHVAAVVPRYWERPTSLTPFFTTPPLFSFLCYSLNFGPSKKGPAIACLIDRHLNSIVAIKLQQSLKKHEWVSLRVHLPSLLVCNIMETRTKTRGRKKKKKLEPCKCLRPASRVTLALHDLTCHVDRAAAAIGCVRAEPVTYPHCPVTVPPFLCPSTVYRVLERLRNTSKLSSPSMER